MAEAEPEAGFTLIEMVVCLALAALLGVLMVSAIRVAGTASVVAGYAATAEEVQSVREHLRRTLGNLARRRIDGTGPVLQGGPDGLRAAIGADQALERPVDLTVVLNGIPRADGAFDFVESRTWLESGPGIEPWEQSEVLLEGVAGLSLRYFGSPTDDTRPVWRPSWIGTGRLPRLVEVQVTFAAHDRRRWAPLVIALGNRR